jgi:hypothetical protein
MKTKLQFATLLVALVVFPALQAFGVTESTCCGNYGGYAFDGNQGSYAVMSITCGGELCFYRSCRVIVDNCAPGTLGCAPTFRPTYPDVEGCSPPWSCPCDQL